jgi:hypothetical protein
MPIIIYRCPHVPEVFNRNFEELFENSDLIYIECPIREYYHRVKKYYKDLSFREYSRIPLSFTFSKYTETLNSFIRNCRKEIEVERSPIPSKKLREHSRILNKTREAFLKGHFKKANKLLLTASELYSQMIKERDVSIARQLASLQTKNRRKTVLGILGISHMPHIFLGRKGLKVKQAFPYKPYIFSLTEELTRRIRFKLPYNKETVARCFPYILLYTYLCSLNLPHPEAVDTARKISEMLSYGDIENLSNFMSKEPYNFYNLTPSLEYELCVFWLKKEKSIDLESFIQK